ncbi:DUF63 family protein [archaeon]|nr:DUF63 family protein [archaeon]
MDLTGFLDYYLVRPWFDCSGYNMINTFVFILALVAITLLIKRLLEKEKIKFDESFFWTLFPYVLFGGILRAIEDLFESPLGCQAARQANPLLILLITPFIYLVLLLLVIAIVLITKKYSKDYKKNTAWIGWALVIASGATVAFYGLNWLEVIAMFAVTGLLSLIMLFAFKQARIYSKVGMAVALGQILDAVATTIAIQFMGYGEQHVFTNALLNINPYLFIPAKMLLAFLVVYSLHKEKNNKWKWIILFIILMIGLAPGIRDALRALMGV